MDESSDKKRQQILCVAGILLNDDQLAALQAAWNDRLTQAGVNFFHYTECKGLHGEFYPYRRLYKDRSRAQMMADAVCSDLESILVSAPWVGFGLGVVLEEYRSVLQEQPSLSMFYREDPNDMAYGQLMWEVAQAVREKAKGCKVAYRVDKSSDYPQIAETFRGVQHNHPEMAETMSTVAPLDDKAVPALQMADLLVGRVREAFVKALKKGEQYGSLDSKWRNHIELVGVFNREHMLINAEMNLEHPRYRSGTLALRPRPKPSGTDMRRLEKQRRKQLMNTTEDIESSE